MSFDVWIAFVAASAALLTVPGPVVMLTVARAAEGGVKATLPLALGTTLGDAFAMTLSLAGLGVFLTASAEAFALLKLMGAGYLVWLGIQSIRQRDRTGENEPGRAERGSFGSAFLVTALHPGDFVFFVAFMPLFIEPERPAFPQLLLLGATFLALAALNVAAWALAAGATRDWLRRPDVGDALRRTSGGLLIATGAVAAWSAVSGWRARTGQV